MSGDVDEITLAEELLAPGGPSLARANLLLAREVAYPELQPSRYLTRLDGWGAEARRRCAAVAGPASRAACLSEFLFGEVGLRGNEMDYYGTQ